MAINECSELIKFTFQKQLAFGYLCSERFYPSYVHFSNNYTFGKPSVLKSAIDYVYNSIFSPIDNSKTDALLQAIDTNSPRPDNFATFYASIAMYSSGIIYESVNLVKHQDISRILNDISTLCTDAVDLFIQERDDMDYDEADFEIKISNDSLMQQEISIQKGIIAYLGKIDQLTSADIDTLLQLQKKGTGTLVL